jgi:hypothetical protein
LHRFILKMKSKKAQIRMSETIAVIFIFFVLIAFGLIFYFKYSETTLDKQNEELFAQRAIDTTTKTLFLPELSCTSGESEIEIFCIDLMKLRAAPDVLKRNLADYYFEIFSFANITVHQIYPTTEKWTIYEKVKPNSTQSKLTPFVVVLKDEQEGIAGQPKYAFGYVDVQVYS